MGHSTMKRIKPFVLIGASIHWVARRLITKYPVASRSRQIFMLNSRIVLKFHRHLGSTAPETHFKFQSRQTSLYLYIAVSGLREICRKGSCGLVNKGPGCSIMHRNTTVMWYCEQQDSDKGRIKAKIILTSKWLKYLLWEFHYNMSAIYIASS